MRVYQVCVMYVRFPFLHRAVGAARESLVSKRGRVLHRSADGGRVPHRMCETQSLIALTVF